MTSLRDHKQVGRRVANLNRSHARFEVKLIQIVVASEVISDNMDSTVSHHIADIRLNKHWQSVEARLRIYLYVTTRQFEF